MKEIIVETLVDSLKLLPFLFFAFLLIEFFEHKFSSKSKKLIQKSEKFGPLFGSLLGIIPQCGFGVAATNLYVTRVISLGTLIAVYLSTSDEMLPLLIAEKAPFYLIVQILLIKFTLGLIFGFVIDLFIKKDTNQDYEICSHDHCGCDKGVFVASLKHTLHIFVFIFCFSFFINLVMHYGGIRYLKLIFLKNNVFGSFLTCLIGLIPNCASSVVLTELFLNGAISYGALIGGLLTCSGVALIVLLKESKDKKEVLKVIGLLYLIGVFSGVIGDLIIKLFN